MTGSLFVTGGTGYIGRHLLPSLDSRRYPKIVSLSRRAPTFAPPGGEIIKADLLEGDIYAPALKGCDTVLHMAAVTGKSRPAEYFRVNREGTKMLLGECRRAGVRRFIYISTIAAKFRNQHRYYYAQSKCQAEELVKSSGLRYTIVRPTIVIGKGAAVLEGLSRLAGAPVIPIFGSGRALVQPVSIEDLIAFVAEMLEGDAFDNQTVEIGGPEVLSMEELLVKIRRAQGKADGPILHLPATLVAAGVGLLESFLLPLLPFTAGQIASFTNDGVADANPCVARTPMKSVDQMLTAVNPS